MKLEELPVNTFVMSKVKGLFTKDVIDDRFVWMEVYGHCSDCCETVSEEGENHPVRAPYIQGIDVPDKAADYLGEFTIVAVPPGFVVRED